MANEVKLPQLGQTMEEGTIVSVLIAEGDQIKKGDCIFEVETDKATLEMESPADGFVKKILVETGQTIPVNSVIVILGDKDEKIDQSLIDSLATVPAAAAAPPQAPAQKPEQAPAQPQQTVAPPAPTGAVTVPPSANVVLLPQLGQTMEEGTIVSVLITEGDEVKKGDCIFEVETDKATLEMESPAGGFVKKILVETGQTVAVKAAILILGDKDEKIDQNYIDSVNSGVAQASLETAPVPAESVAEPQPVQTKTAKSAKYFASPRAKAAAKKLNVDLSTVSPAPGAARITEADVQKAAKAPAAAIPQSAFQLGEKIKPSRLQKITGQKMLQSKQQIPCFYLTTIVDATDMFNLRIKLNKSGDVKISFNDFIIKAVAEGLKQFPIMTGQPAGDFIQLASGIHVGLAIAVPDGLVAPLIRDADKKTLTQIAAYGKELIARAKSNKLSPDDLQGGCITVSNLGGFGIDNFIPIVVPGQCSIIGIGKITDTYVPIDRNIIVRKLMNITISVDHRVANGADAAQFLDFIKKSLENPENLI